MRQISALLDIDPAILIKIERGERNATKEQIANLVKIIELDKDALLIQFLSEKVLCQIQYDDLGMHALKVAEEKMKYLKSKKKSTYEK